MKIYYVLLLFCVVIVLFIVVNVCVQVDLVGFGIVVFVIMLGKKEIRVVNWWFQKVVICVFGSVKGLNVVNIGVVVCDGVVVLCGLVMDSVQF